MSNTAQNKQDELQQVEQVLSRSEAFIEKYQKQLLLTVAVAVLLVLAVLAFKNFYLGPQEREAENEMAKAQAAFAVDSFKVALNGKADIIGFEEIVSEYSMTPSGNLAAAYAGICYYKLGQYENAVKYLSKYDGDDNYFTTSVIGLIGDAYVEMGKKEDAVDYFVKAADKKNEVLSSVYLKKAGIAYEALTQPEKALELYTKIKDSYPRSTEAADIDKYIARVEK
ncbi:MAG: tetratricopeptide repeat protein [Paludibacter sp.]|nr:tetratricopeptide repeat protein [Paludibacter sp.]